MTKNKNKKRKKAQNLKLTKNRRKTVDLVLLIYNLKNG
jgi:Fe2+ or Zn2+ uptake regulation protein